MGKNNKGKAPKVHAGESFADAVREGTPADPHGDQNAALKPGESYADAVQEGLPESSSSDAPPAYSANGKQASDSKTPSSTQVQSSGQSGQSSSQSKGHTLHLPNSHHSHRLGSPSPSPGGHHSHPHSHHFSTQQGGGGGGVFAAQFGRGGDEEGVVMVPEREYIYALMRARRRFWATLFWALLIYLVAG